MNELTCTKCGLMFIDIEGVLKEIPLPSGGSHIKCSCPGCGKYIKFLPHQTGEAKFYFGKHKGKTVTEVMKIDKEYLRWLLTQDIGGRIGQAIRQALQEN